MSPVYLNPPPSSPIPFLELKGDQNTIHILGQRHDQYSTTSDETLALEYARHPQEIKVENSNDNGQVLQSSSWPQNFSDGGGFSYGYASNHGNQNKIDMNTSNDQKYSKRWKPSKVRIMQKMMATSKNMGEQHKLQHSHLERQQSNVYRNNSSDNNNGIRVCTDCHTTTTPLWRSGPRGPKSLCNACGIRQRKARRAAMAAAEAAAFAKEEGVTPMSIDSPKLKVPQDQEMTGENSGYIDNKISHPLPLKKRGKIVEATTSRNYNNNNNNNRFNTSSNKDYMRSTSQRVFPRDEEEGAILLMALSCG